MKERELFLEKIKINETFSMQVDPEKQETLIIYKNGMGVESFSLRKRIYTLFKTLQEYTNSTDFVIEKEKKYKLYGQAIHIKDDIYMQINDKHDSMIIEFYKIEDNKKEILYLMKTDYMTQKLFHQMLIPEKVLTIPNFQVMNPTLFKDFIDIISVIKI